MATARSGSCSAHPPVQAVVFIVHSQYRNSEAITNATNWDHRMFTPEAARGSLTPWPCVRALARGLVSTEGEESKHMKEPPLPVATSVVSRMDRSCSQSQLSRLRPAEVSQPPAAPALPHSTIYRAMH
jgi:hypothetical protein